MTRATSSIEKVRDFFVGGGFPVFAIVMLACWEVLLVGILLTPASPTALGAFAENFRIWCFGFDPATGRMESAYVASMLLPQSLMIAFIAFFWWEPLRSMLRHPRSLAVYAGSAALLVAGSAGGFALAGAERDSGELPFPAEAIRTAFVPPAFSLTNQEGATVELTQLQGRVVLLTAVYASCGHTCPMILTQTRAAIAELDSETLADLTVVAVTMDPANDSGEVLARLAEGHDMQAPLYNLVTGPSVEVNRVLDDMQVARRRDSETGVIEHANLFLLIDREGRLAYRIGLGDRQQRWLTAALRVLLKEPQSSG